MLDNFFGMFQTHTSTMTELMGWRWATEHPYLFTLIQVSKTLAIAIMLLLGARVIGRMFLKRGR